MRVHLIFITIAGLLILGGICSAAYIPDNTSTISSNSPNDWVVVAQPSTITVVANNATGGPVQNASVSLSLNSTTWGTLSTVSATTNAAGTVSSIFTAGTKSGAVDINAMISYIDNGTTYTVPKTYTLNIDHGTAYSALYTYNIQATVATETPFNFSYTDKYGNPIDNRNHYDPHSVALTIGSQNTYTAPGLAAAFNINGTYSESATQLLDANGNISVKVLTDTAPCANTITISMIYPVLGYDYYSGDNRYYDSRKIYGQSNAVPASIDPPVISPAGLLPADGESDHKFTIVYTLHDRYNNLAVNQSVLIHSDWPGDVDQTTTTNDYGQIYVNYGPHTASGNITLTATAVANSSVTCSCQIGYYSTAPVNMVFAASPDTMPSLGANSSLSTSSSELSVKVMDIMGNAVANESVSFSISNATYDDPNVIATSDPYLLNYTMPLKTDSNGFATVTFIPGAISNNTSSVYYNPTATGTVKATATWNGESQYLTLTWKNYPYLKVTTSISPSVVAVNDPINVTIKMVGDGFALNGKPSDIVIVTDLAGGVGGDTLLTNTQKADVAFVKNATNTTYIGLVSFGAAPTMASTNATLLWTKQQNTSNHALFNPYGSVTDYNLRNPTLWNTAKDAKTIIQGPPTGKYNPWTGVSASGYINGFSDATIDSNSSFISHQLELQNGTLQSAIADYKTRAHNTAGCGSPECGGTDYAAGINAAIELFGKNPHSSHSKSIVLMGDGISMMAPISPGSKESYWPSDWYPRSYYSGYTDESDTATNAALDAATRAKAAGINIYVAAFPLGGNTNNTTLKAMISDPGNFYYTPDSSKLQSIMSQIQGKIQNTSGVNTVMTMDLSNASISYANSTNLFSYMYNPPVSTNITWQNSTTTVIDQSSEWNSSHKLTFYVGNITIGQTWQTTFQLKALQQGIFDICGNNSNVNFNNGEDKLNLTGCPVTVINISINNGISSSILQLSDLKITQNGAIIESLPIQWNVTYTGNQTIDQYIYYSTDRINWVQSQAVSVPGKNQTVPATLDVRSWPAGTYYIEIQASTAQPEGLSTAIIMPGTITIGNSQKAYIKLE